MYKPQICKIDPYGFVVHGHILFFNKTIFI